MTADAGRQSTSCRGVPGEDGRCMACGLDEDAHSATAPRRDSDAVDHEPFDGCCDEGRGRSRRMVRVGTHPNGWHAYAYLTCIRCAGPRRAGHAECRRCRWSPVRAWRMWRNR